MPVKLLMLVVSLTFFLLFYDRAFSTYVLYEALLTTVFISHQGFVSSLKKGPSIKVYFLRYESKE